ncbi:protein kinase STUNTED isoform X2 [Alnus glutinosa]|uniref:protein kinase STUNTED isoform X2 n=1 Tax=Alnus glutinosa TaxID=3517 RepID=UPI002D787D1A|nr:protein kinase STUNTED isoform X2 [Alnus glutinosa]
MRWTGDRTAGELSDDGGGGGRTVVVGVKFDSQSRELLTWALVKVAQPGDCVIALHVIDCVCGTASLLSLVKTFDSVLSVYDGFCSLKQVDLRLKVCRGSKVQKILVREAKLYGEATVIVGASKAHKRIGSSASFAKYCARKLSKYFGVFAVNNGKVVFQRAATSTNAHQLRGRVTLEKPGLGLTKQNCLSCSADVGNCETQFTEELPVDGGEDNSLALVPYQSLEADTNSSSVVIQESPELKSGWSILRWAFLAKRPYVEKSLKRTSVFQWVLRLPNWQSSAVVYPDQKKSNCDQEDDNCSSLDEDSSAIVPFGSATVCPLSPCSGLGNLLPKELLGLREKYSSSCMYFSYQELLLATSNFMPENMVGKGGSSHVYKGCLPDGKELAVKILKPSQDVLKEFVQEIEIITTLHHKNIISLVGFCFEDNNLILVYDFLSRGSLEENLHGNKKDGKGFGWQERYNVAMGVAEALDFLHNSCAEPVIHRDVKSSNILLSGDFEPQLSDFGLASWASTSSNTTCTDVAGTFGYLAPEYFMHGKVSDKIDVYAFGVVLLELLSGRKPIISECPKGQESLVMWAKPILNGGKVFQLLDPSLGSNYDDDQIERMVLAATLCIRREPRLRPQISLILKVLQGDEEVTRWAKQLVRTSEEVDALDGEAFYTNIKSHLNVALLELEDDSVCISSSEKSVLLEDYLFKL